jgi:hypothetical protein
MSGDYLWFKRFYTDIYVFYLRRIDRHISFSPVVWFIVTRSEVINGDSISIHCMQSPDLIHDETVWPCRNWSDELHHIYPYAVFPRRSANWNNVVSHLMDTLVASCIYPRDHIFSLILQRWFPPYLLSNITFFFYRSNTNIFRVHSMLLWLFKMGRLYRNLDNTSIRRPWSKMGRLCIGIWITRVSEGLEARWVDSVSESG